MMPLYRFSLTVTADNEPRIVTGANVAPVLAPVLATGGRPSFNDFSVPLGEAVL